MAKPKPYEINRDQRPDASNPHSWLVRVGHAPGESLAGWRVMTGTLRPSHRGFRPSLAAFAQAKLAPAAGDDALPWTVTAYRHEVLLPPHAGDHLRDPRTLFESAEREQPADGKALACYVTLTSTPDRLHAAWEAGRTLVRRLVDRYDVGALLVQHVPALASGSAAPHLHIIIPGPRRLERWSGFGTFVSELAGDRMRDLVLARLADSIGEASR